jgi:hypothetical protein
MRRVSLYKLPNSSDAAQISAGRNQKTRHSPKDGILWDNMGNNGRQWVLACFSWEKASFSIY